MTSEDKQAQGREIGHKLWGNERFDRMEESVAKKAIADHKPKGE